KPTRWRRQSSATKAPGRSTSTTTTPWPKLARGSTLSGVRCVLSRERRRLYAKVAEALDSPWTVRCRRCPFRRHRRDRGRRRRRLGRARRRSHPAHDLEDRPSKKVVRLIGRPVQGALFPQLVNLSPSATAEGSD